MTGPYDLTWTQVLWIAAVGAPVTVVGLWVYWWWQDRRKK